MRHRLKWFIDRIGKTIYRGEVPCKCKHCKKKSVKIWDGIEENGKRSVRRDFHAQYLVSCQDCLDIEYFDKPVKE